MGRLPFSNVLLAACWMAAVSSSAQAQPSNDTYPARTSLFSTDLPFLTVVDTSQATTDADDVEINGACGAPATDASVWYDLVTASDAAIRIDVSQSNYPAGIIVAKGTPGSFETITCGPQGVEFQAIAGETYAILAFDDQSDEAGNGGELRLGISAQAGDADLLARIRALPGVATAAFVPGGPPGTLFFRILFEQPVDHGYPHGSTFLQRLTLLHRSDAARTVLAINGYNISNFPAPSELTYLLEANQLDVEHRFFPPSSPSPTSWEHLSIAQSAADHHRIVESFKNLYAGKWVSTGRSKGGMAAVYHRFFYPTDVDATVPYVAPSSHGPRDARYVQFVDRLGTAQCRQALLDFQRSALARRLELEALLPPHAFGILGVDRAVEFAIVETPFAFWQYFRFNSCDAIPQPDASPSELLDFLDYVTSLFTYADTGLNAYAAYYYQAATELGGPRFDERRLHGLLNYPREDIAENYPPIDVEKDFDRSLMQLVEQWVRTLGQRILFIYGANDPWSATAFDVRAKNDSYRLFVNGSAGDHLAGVFDLSESEFTLAVEKLNEWLGEGGQGMARAHAKRQAKQFARPTKAELFLR
jgi:hypothetical protein